MKYANRQPGQPNDFIDSASMWNDIFDLLNAFHSGSLDQRESQTGGNVGIGLINSSGDDRDAYEVLQIDSLEDMPSSAIKDAFYSRPTLEAITPVWHTEIDNLVVVPGVVDNGQFRWQPRSWATVKVTVMEDDDTYVMLDPENLNQMKTSDTGPWKILALDTTNNLAIVDLTKGSFIWRYELTEASQAPETTSAKLLRLDGAEFGGTIELSDPEEMTEDKDSGYKGFCIHVGNSFYDIAGPC